MKPTPLEYIDSETLMNKVLPPIHFAISDLLPQGLSILAGAPKIGKSWLALWLCLCVARGESVWEFQTEKSDVFYFCLEDSYTRIRNRLLEITDDAATNLYIATMSDKLHNGLEGQLEQVLTEHPDTRLVVIDTLQRVRPVFVDSNAYANDYHDIGTLKALADKHGIAILLIHHLRKMNDADPMNMISGTTGISGATDSNFVLRRDSRGENTATLYCTGRDIEYRELNLEFDAETHIWKRATEVEVAQPKRDEILFSVSAFMFERSSFAGTATELAEELKNYCEQVPLPNVLSKYLIRHSDELWKMGVRLETKRTRDKRELKLTLLSDGNDDNDGKNDTDPVENLLSLPSQPSPNYEKE